MITSQDARLVFDNARAAIANIRDSNGMPMYSLKEAKLTQSYLRSEVFLSTANAKYQFPIKINDQFTGTAIQPTEQRLQLQDVFIVSYVGLFLGLGATGSSTYKLNSYADPSVFTTGGVETAGAIPLETVYNGLLKLEINNNVIVPAWDLIRHKKVPNQQPADNAYYTTSAIKYVSEFSGIGTGFYPTEPNWILSGGANINLSINLPSAPATLDTNTRVALILRGILAQNVSAVK